MGDAERVPPAVARFLCAIWVCVVLFAACGDASPREQTASPAGSVKDATVRVENVSCLGVGVGSGVALEDDLLATNRHVVEGARELRITTSEGRPLTVPVVSVSLRRDVAFVRVQGRLQAVDSVRPGRLDPGDEVFVVGYPRRSGLDSARGDVVDYTDGTRVGQSGDVLRLDAQIRQGHSGGPVVDPSGSVRGLVFGIERATGLALAIPGEVLFRRPLSSEFGAPVGC